MLKKNKLRHDSSSQSSQVGNEHRADTQDKETDHIKSPESPHPERQGHSASVFHSWETIEFASLAEVPVPLQKAKHIVVIWG